MKGRQNQEFPDAHALNDNSIFNQELVFVDVEATTRLKESFVGALEAGSIPNGLTSPIASGPARKLQSMRNCETLAANLALAVSKGKSSLSISLNRSDYGNGPLSAGVLNQVKLGAHESRGLWTKIPGYRDHLNPKNSRQTRLIPTDKFRCLLDSCRIRRDLIYAKPHELILLRRGRGRDKRDIPRKEWWGEIDERQRAYLPWLEACIERFNHVYRATSFKYQADTGERRLYPQLHAVYTDDFNQGGRLYTGFGGHQGLSAAERRTIRIDDRPTIELDFGGLHVRMLYHLAGDDFSPGADVYGMPLEVLDRHPVKTFEDVPGLRGDFKGVLLGLVNGTGTRKQLVSNARRRLFEDWHDAKTYDTYQRNRRECEERQDRWEVAKLSVEEVVNAFFTAHERIVRYFGAGIGLRLQCIDARIARYILTEFMIQNQTRVAPCLPVHDSFIVPIEYETMLREAMQRGYRLIMRRKTGSGGMFQIPIKQG